LSKELTEIDGVDPDEDPPDVAVVLAPVFPAEPELPEDDLFELPHAVTKTAAAAMGTRALNLPAMQHSSILGAESAYAPQRVSLFVPGC
jgi:hypothetical protein